MEIGNNSLVLIILAFIIGYCLPQLMQNMCGSRRVKYFEPSAKGVVGGTLGTGAALALVGKGLGQIAVGSGTDAAAVVVAPEGGILGPSELAGAAGGTLIVDGGGDLVTGVTALGDSAITAGGSTLRMMETADWLA